MALKGGSVAYNEWWGTPVGFIEYIRYLCLGPPEPFSAHSACFPRVFRVFRVFSAARGKRGKRGKRAEKHGKHAENTRKRARKKGRATRGKSRSLSTLETPSIFAAEIKDFARY